MKFTPNQTVLDGGDRYEAGQEYDVPEDRVMHMVSLDWGAAPDLKPEPGAWSEPAVTATTLAVDDASSGSG